METRYQKNHARGAAGLVMDVHTGAIVALATYPVLRRQRVPATDAEPLTNPAVSRQYEPGSVMKAFTIAAALDAGAITTSTKVVDDNNLAHRKVRIQNADRYSFPYGHGAITAGGRAEAVEQHRRRQDRPDPGRRGLYDAFKRYGFGSPTGVDIAGEACRRGVEPGRAERARVT